MHSHQTAFAIFFLFESLKVKRSVLLTGQVWHVLKTGGTRVENH